MGNFQSFLKKNMSMGWQVHVIIFVLLASTEFGSAQEADSEDESYTEYSIELGSSYETTDYVTDFNYYTYNYGGSSKNNGDNRVIIGSPDYNSNNYFDDGGQGSQDYNSINFSDDGDQGSQDYDSINFSDDGDQGSQDYDSINFSDDGDQGSQDYDSINFSDDGDQGSQDYDNINFFDGGDQGSQDYDSTNFFDGGGQGSQDYNRDFDDDDQVSQDYNSDFDDDDQVSQDYSDDNNDEGEFGSRYDGNGYGSYENDDSNVRENSKENEKNSSTVLNDGQDNEENNVPYDFKKQGEEFSLIFAESVLTNPNFRSSSQMDYQKAIKMLLKDISLLEVSEVDPGQRDVLIVTFAAHISELIIVESNESVSINDKVNIVTSALRKAYIDTNEEPNEELIRKVEVLVNIFISEEEHPVRKLLPKHTPGSKIKIDSNHRFFPEYPAKVLELMTEVFPQLDPQKFSLPDEYRLTYPHLNYYSAKGDVPEGHEHICLKELVEFLFEICELRYKKRLEIFERHANLATRKPTSFEIFVKRRHTKRPRGFEININRQTATESLRRNSIPLPPDTDSEEKRYIYRYLRIHPFKGKRKKFYRYVKYILRRYRKLRRKHTKTTTTLSPSSINIQFPPNMNPDERRYIKFYLRKHPYKGQRKNFHSYIRYILRRYKHKKATSSTAQSTTESETTITETTIVTEITTQKSLPEKSTTVTEQVTITEPVTESLPVSEMSTSTNTMPTTEIETTVTETTIVTDITTLKSLPQEGTTVKEQITVTEPVTTTETVTETVISTDANPITESETTVTETTIVTEITTQKSLPEKSTTVIEQITITEPVKENVPLTEVSSTAQSTTESETTVTEATIVTEITIQKSLPEEGTTVIEQITVTKTEPITNVQTSTSRMPTTELETTRVKEITTLKSLPQEGTTIIEELTTIISSGVLGSGETTVSNRNEATIPENVIKSFERAQSSTPESVSGPRKEEIRIIYCASRRKPKTVTDSKRHIVALILPETSEVSPREVKGPNGQLIRIVQSHQGSTSGTVTNSNGELEQIILPRPNSTSTTKERSATEQNGNELLLDRIKKFNLEFVRKLVIQGSTPKMVTGPKGEEIKTEYCSKDTQPQTVTDSDGNVILLILPQPISTTPIEETTVTETTIVTEITTQKSLPQEGTTITEHITTTEAITEKKPVSEVSTTTMPTTEIETTVTETTIVTDITTLISLPQEGTTIKEQITVTETVTTTERITEAVTSTAQNPTTQPETTVTETTIVTEITTQKSLPEKSTTVTEQVTITEPVTENLPDSETSTSTTTMPTTEIETMVIETTIVTDITTLKSLPQEGTTVKEQVTVTEPVTERKPVTINEVNNSNSDISRSLSFISPINLPIEFEGGPQLLFESTTASNKIEFIIENNTTTESSLKQTTEKKDMKSTTRYVLDFLRRMSNQGSTPSEITGPDGKNIRILYCSLCTEPQAVTESDGEVLFLLLPKPSTTTPSTTTRNAVEDIRKQIVIKGTTPQVVTVSNGRSIIIIYCSPGTKPQAITDSEDQVLLFFLPQNPEANGVTVSGPHGQLIKIVSNNSSFTPGAVTNKNGDIVKIVLPNPPKPPPEESKLSSTEYKIIYGSPETEPQAIMDTDGKLALLLLPQNSNKIPPYVSCPNGRIIQLSQELPNNPAGYRKNEMGHITEVILPSLPNVVQQFFPGYVVVDPHGEVKANYSLANRSTELQKYGVLYSSKGEFNSLITLRQFENIFTVILKSGTQRVQELISAILKSKGKASGKFDLEVFVQELSSIFGDMKFEKHYLNYPELFVELLVDALIAALEVIRSLELECIENHTPTSVQDVSNYVDVLKDVLF